MSHFTLYAAPPYAALHKRLAPSWFSYLASIGVVPYNGERDGWR